MPDSAAFGVVVEHAVLVVPDDVLRPSTYDPLNPGLKAVTQLKYDLLSLQCSHLTFEQSSNEAGS